MIDWVRRNVFLLLFLPPAAAVLMGILLLTLALKTNPGTIDVDAEPLSKTSWRQLEQPATTVPRP